MQVKYSIEHVGAKGRGIVARQDVPKGALVWSGEHSQVRVFKTPAEFTAFLDPLPLEEQRKALMFAYGWDGAVFLVTDEARFMNHSRDCNIGTTAESEDNLYALRDIKEGEEFLEDYGVYARVPWFEEIAKARGATSCLELLRQLGDDRFP